MQIVNSVINPCKLGLFKSLSILIAALVLSACGQRGSLYLPQVPAGTQRTSLVESVTAKPESASSKATSNDNVDSSTTTPAAVKK
ncbi:MAG TPA: lipoprotein [Burkholderiaceae bacterium]|nr:lipoprotein [Burkholderiaceae bacterium]